MSKHEDSWERLDTEFDHSLLDMKPYVLKHHNKTERQRCAIWIKKLCDPATCPVCSFTCSKEGSWRGLSPANQSPAASRHSRPTWVSWIFLLFDCSAGLPAKEHGYRYTADSRNQVEVQNDDYDDDQDDTLNSENFDQSDWKTSTNQLIFLDDTSYSKPSVAQRPGSVPSLQNLHNTQSSGAVQRLVNGRPRDWSLDDPAKELVFPLSPNYPQHAPVRHQPGPVLALDQPGPVLALDQPGPVPTRHQLGPVHTRYPSGNTRHPTNTAGWYSNANYMGTGSSPSSTQQGSFPSYPTYVGAQHFYPSRLGSPSSGFYGGGNRIFRQINYWPQTPVFITQKVSELGRLPLSSYIIQSRNGYQRARYHQSKSRYSPEVPLQRGV